MTIYDIEVIMVNDNLISIGKSYLNHNDKGAIKSWDVELYDVKNDTLFSDIMQQREQAVVKIGTQDGSSFIGKTIITKLNIGPLGTTVLLQGNGPLQEV